MSNQKLNFVKTHMKLIAIIAILISVFGMLAISYALTGPTLSLSTTVYTNGNVTLTATASTVGSNERWWSSNATALKWTDGDVAATVSNYNNAEFFSSNDTSGVDRAVSETFTTGGKITVIARYQTRPNSTSGWTTFYKKEVIDIPIDTFNPAKPSLNISSTWSNADLTVTPTSSDTGGSGLKGYLFKVNNVQDAGIVQNHIFTSSLSNAKVEVSAVDNAGNTSAWLVLNSVNVNIDKLKPAKPSLSISSAWRNTNLTATTTSSDTGGSGINGYRIKVNNVQDPGIVQNHVFTSSISNATVEVQAVDNAGNESDWLVLTGVNVNIDQSSPTLTLSQNPTVFTKSNVTLTANSSDAGGSGFKQVKLPDNSVSANATTTYNVTANGSYTFEAVDNAGNIKSETIVVSNIDKTNPTLTFTQNPITSTWTNGSVVITPAGADTGGSGVKSIKYNNQIVTNLSATNNGTYTFTVEDNAGNTANFDYIVSNIDKTAPVIKYTASPLLTVPADKYTITPNITDATSPVKVQKWAYGTYTVGSFPTGTLISGAFDVSLAGPVTMYAEDSAGNKSVEVLYYTISDTTPPSIVLTQAALDQISGTIKAVVTDAKTGVDVIKYLKGDKAIADFATAGSAVTSDVPFMVMENGWYTVYAIDKAGNAKVEKINVNVIKGRLNFSAVEFFEDDANDGTVKTDVTVTVDGLRFKSGQLAIGTDLTTGTAIPSNLNLVASVSDTNNQSLKLSFSGSATSHAALNSFVRTLTFNNSAFLATSNPDQDNLAGNGQKISVFLKDPASIKAETGAFTESTANDGSIADARALILLGADFSQSGLEDGKFKEGLHYSIENLPAGLKAEVTRDSNSKIMLRFSGKATAHAGTNSVTAVRLVLNAKAFSPEVLPLNATTTFAITFRDKAVLKVLEIYPSGINGASDQVVASTLLNGTTSTGPQYIKWVITKRKTGTAESIQVSELELYNGTTKVVWPAGTVATNPGGSSPAAEMPPKAIDGSRAAGSKWLDFNFNGANTTNVTGKSELVINLGVGNTVSFDRYKYITANDTTSRDPVSWELFVSSDNVNWISVDKRDDLAITNSRNVEAGTWILATPVTPVSQVNATSYDVTSMSLNKFISLTDPVNGLYDVVYFGAGLYAPNDVTEREYGNDITNLAAQKVNTFIHGGQLVVFHSDALSNTNTKMYANFQDDITNATLNVVRITNTAALKGAVTGKLATTNKRPVLTMIEKPLSYRELGIPLESNNLKVTFEAADPDVMDTVVDAKMYIDRNSNGLFEAGEAVEFTSRKVNYGKAETYFYTMPLGLTGVYPWKVVITDTKGAASEYADIFYLKSNPININVLQVMPNGNNVDLSDKLTAALLGNPANSLGYKQGEYKITVVKATVAEFNAPSSSDTKNLMNLNGNYNMIIFGFADVFGGSDFSNTLNTGAVARINKFLATKQSVMFTHDMIMFDNSLNVIKTNFQETVGQKVAGSTAVFTAGHIARYTPSDTEHTTYDLGGYAAYTPNGGNTKYVTKVNSSAMSLYPFNLEKVDQSAMTVAETHYQYYKLNLEDEEIIPMFNLYKSTSGSRFNEDAMNNYYTYSKGNVTYSGTGHKNDYELFEMQMFVNTMLKAYASGNHAPDLRIYEPTDNAKLDYTKNTFKLSFSANDYDEDSVVKYSVYLDKENNGSFTSVMSDQAISLGEIKNLTITTGLKDQLRIFNLKVVATDELGATSEKILKLYNTDIPQITPVMTTDKSIYFVGETIDFEIGVNPTGKVVEETRIINPTVELTLPNTVSYNSIKGQVLSYTLNGTYAFNLTGFFTPTGVATPPLDIASLPLLITDAGTGILNLSAKSQYVVDGASVNNLPVTHSVTVRDGRVDVVVKDTSGKPMKNVAILENSVATGTQTDVSGSKQYLGVSRGDHNYSITVPAGYILDKIETRDLPSGAYTTVWNRLTSGSQAQKGEVTLDTALYAWEVKFTVKLNLEIPITYYQVLPNNDVQMIGTDDGKGTAAQLFGLKVQKGGKIRIAALIDMPMITSNDVQHMGIFVETGLPAESELLKLNVAGQPAFDRTRLKADILDGTIVPGSFANTYGFLASSLKTPALLDSKRLNEEAVPAIPPAPLVNPVLATGTYASTSLAPVDKKSYHVIFDIDYAYGQTIWISSIRLQMSNGSVEEVPLDRIKINVKDLDIPLLQ